MFILFVLIAVPVSLVGSIFVQELLFVLVPLLKRINSHSTLKINFEHPFMSKIVNFSAFSGPKL